MTCGSARCSTSGLVQSGGAAAAAAERTAANMATTDVWRRGWDSNPRHLAVLRFSRPVPSTTRPPLRRYNSTLAAARGAAPRFPERDRSMRRMCTAGDVLLAVLAAATAQAGETGSISGIVKDSQGGVLPGVTVRVSGPMLPAGRDATTTDNGAYVFEQLLPGVYTVDASLTGLGNAKRQVQVQVDR